MPDIVIVLIGMVVGLALGSQITLLVIETKHGCMPHDPQRCALTTQPSTGEHR